MRTRAVNPTVPLPGIGRATHLPAPDADLEELGDDVDESAREREELVRRRGADARPPIAPAEGPDRGAETR